MSIVGTNAKVDQQAQPSGIPVHGSSRGGRAPLAGSDEALLQLHAQLVALVPDAEERAATLGVPAAVDAAWLEGRMIPVLRARRKPLQTLVEQLTRARAEAPAPD